MWRDAGRPDPDILRQPTEGDLQAVLAALSELARAGGQTQHQQPDLEAFLEDISRAVEKIKLLSWGAISVSSNKGFQFSLEVFPVTTLQCPLIKASDFHRGRSNCLLEVLPEASLQCPSIKASDFHWKCSRRQLFSVR